MSLSAQFEAVEGADRRSSNRRALRLTITASLPQSPNQSVAIHDLSETGLLLETHAELTNGQTFQVLLPVAGVVEATVMWSSRTFFGCQFAAPVVRAAVSAALLQSSPKDDLSEPVPPQGGMLSQLRDLTARIERVRHDIDRAIERLSQPTPGSTQGEAEGLLTAALPRTAILPPPKDVRTPERLPHLYAEPEAFENTSATRPAVLIALVLAGLAALTLIAALWP